MTLTETVFWTKIASQFAIVGIVMLIGGYYGYIYIVGLSRTPDQVFRADYACGVLPQVTIEAQEGADISSAQIKVDALSTSLPDVPYITYVYKINVQGETFATRDNAFALADSLQFVKDDFRKAPGSTTYSWRNKLKRTNLTVDTSTLNFTYVYDDATLPASPNLELPATTFRAPEIAQTYLSALGLYTGDFANGQVYSLPITMKGGQSYEAKSLDEAQLIRVDFQKTNTLLAYDKTVSSATYAGPQNIDFEGFLDAAPKDGTSNAQYLQFAARRVGKTPQTANVQVYIKQQAGAPSDGVHQIIFNNWHVEDKPCGTYTVIRPADAVRQIGSGEGKVVLLVEKGGDTLQAHTVLPVTEVNLYKLELVYYETMTPQPYLQPIYVATGEVVFNNGAKGDIAIYMPAIDYSAKKK